MKPSFILVEHSLAAVIVQKKSGMIRLKLIQSKIFTLIPALSIISELYFSILTLMAMRFVLHLGKKRNLKQTFVFYL